MRVYVTARGDSYHSIPTCSKIVAGQRAALNNGNEVHPAREMPLDEAQAWKPVRGCPQCWEGAQPSIPRQGRPSIGAELDGIEVRYEIGFGPAATTAKGFLIIPREMWLAILPEDRDDRVLEMIRAQAAEQLRVTYRTVE